ncbi:tetratricopeptide repeat protein [Halomonadaceae bacterium KBTZ08]
MTVQPWLKWPTLGIAVVLLAGCSVRYAPPEGGGEAPIGTRTEDAEPAREPSDKRQPETSQQVERQRDTGGGVPEAAKGLLGSADAALAAGDGGRALDLVQRAQRIAPDAAAVYYALGRVHRQQGNLARAEQFVLKGISKAGNDGTLRDKGWSELAGIRARLGDQAGAEAARERAGQR